MNNFFQMINRFLNIHVLGDLTLYETLSTVFKYLFVFIIFYFIYTIVRVIYYDIRTSMRKESITDTYLKLLNKTQGFRFLVQEYYYLENSNLIGRDIECNISIQDKFLSNKHCKIFQKDGLYFLEDLDSANGTFLNNERIKDVVELRSGDRITVGQMEFLFVEGGDND